MFIGTGLLIGTAVTSGQDNRFEKISYTVVGSMLISFVAILGVILSGQAYTLSWYENLRMCKIKK